jgi:hypothetical protein
MSELPVDSPLVMALADFTDKDFEENPLYPLDTLLE